MSDDHETDRPGEAHAGPGATEAARELAAANMVDLDEIRGTGADGKITKADVEEQLAKRDAAGFPTVAGADANVPTVIDKDEYEAAVGIAPSEPSSGGHAPKIWTGPRR